MPDGSSYPHVTVSAVPWLPAVAAGHMADLAARRDAALRVAGHSLARLRRHQDRLQSALLAILTMLLAARFFRVHAMHPIAANHLPAHAWFGWADQSEYYRAAQAWAAGNLDGTQHHYPAGYALLGALFMPFMPQEPFALVDVLCWCASLWVFAALSAQLFPTLPGARAIGGLAFFMSTVRVTGVFYTWLTPWTSTPACLCILTAMLTTLRYAEAAELRHAFVGALSAGLVIMFRPTDFLVVAPPVGCFLLITAWRHTSRPTLSRTVAIPAMGGLIGPILLVATHLATQGLALGSYFELSRQIGFEWRLLPLRWVTLMLDPTPLYPVGMGLAEAYWWMLPGMAGILACSLSDRGRRLHHVLVGGAGIAFLCVYLCYRDLHVPGLFGYSNQHYFKWLIPLFALYTLGLAYITIIRRRWLAGAGAVVVVAGLSCWRAELVITRPVSESHILPDGHGMTLPHGLAPLDSVYLAASPEDTLGLYLGEHEIDGAGVSLRSNRSFKVFPVPYGFMLAPLRPIAAQDLQLHLKLKPRIDPTEPVLAGRQEIVFGVPCAFWQRRDVCRYHNGLRPGS